jgi:hypothetical protein
LVKQEIEKKDQKKGQDKQTKSGDELSSLKNTI